MGEKKALEKKETAGTEITTGNFRYKNSKQNPECK
jgi:hypothetical protein